MPLAPSNKNYLIRDSGTATPGGTLQPIILFEMHNFFKILFFVNSEFWELLIKIVSPVPCRDIIYILQFILLYFFISFFSAKTVKTLPALSLKVTGLLEQLKQAYRAFTNGQFSDCRTSLDTIITSIPLGKMIFSLILRSFFVMNGYSYKHVQFY